MTERTLEFHIVIGQHRLRPFRHEEFAAHEIQPLGHLVLMHESRSRPLLPFRPKELIQVKANVGVLGHARDAIRELVNEHVHPRKCRVGIRLSGILLRPFVLRVLLVGIRPVENLRLVKFAVLNRPKRRS